MIRMKNVYYMLAYAYQTLNEEGFSSVKSEDFENVHDLMAAILIREWANHAKEYKV
ncbi:hypothetical protein UF75_4980 [Desulfosporosinus sp. I2]|uniref:hypothetical protein n=1 Tax=Desulfosporosinus sp. I2 TaxID=1617025 RepID=UPI00061E736B|nr:hypothetical protein [Desulfosporosinus sp. I2]KJR44632.1 hypothetical protein UF75_4980 [Desulfosporosinus sp. I2]